MSKKHNWDIVKAVTETRTIEAKEIRKQSIKKGKDFSPRRGKELKLREDDNANTVTANQGVEQLIVLQVKSATKNGFEEAKEGDSINLSMPNSNTRRGRVGVGVAQTLDTQSNQSVLLQGDIRRLTEIECERLQGFKDNHTEYGIYETQVWINKKEKTFEIVSGVKKIPKTQRYKLCGNAVNVDTAKLVTDKLFDNF